jgi:hypothetical protein
MRALKAKDVLVACRLAVGGRIRGKGEPTRRELADELFMGLSSVQESVQSLLDRGIVVRAPNRRGSAVVAQGLLTSVLVSVVPILYPAERIGIVWGMPTSVFGNELAERFAGSRGAVVWPYAAGTVSGNGLVPLYPTVPRACAKNVALHKLLAAVDVLRVGLAREREAAEKYIAEVVGRSAERSDVDERER